jgi:3-oxoacyl-[acyl-carrier-protein] synthase-3
MQTNTHPIGILGYGLYLPTPRHTAQDVADGSGGRWTAEAVREKLGLWEKPMPGPEDGTQEMGVRAAKDALRRTGVDPMDLDLILCMGEEYKEYPLTTSGIYIQEAIGARRAWAIDVQQRCNTTVAALKIAKDMMTADEDLKTVMIVGGYRNGDLIDYADPTTSFMYNLAAGAGALILRRGYDKNVVLASEITTDGSMSRDVGQKYGGTLFPIEKLPEEVLAGLRVHGNKTLTVMQPEHMKDTLNAIGFTRWLDCLDRALRKSNLTRKDVGYLNILHFKPSMHAALLDTLGLKEEQSFYLKDYGHLGQVDPILSIHHGLQTGRLKDGQVMAILTAGIGYVWGVSLVRWG